MDRPVPELTLLDAAHTVARVGDLESELQTLAGHVLTVSGARAAAVYLLDPVGQRLVPAATAGIDEDRLAEAEDISLGDDGELVAQVALHRRPMTSAGGASAALLDGATSAQSGLIAVPLVAADESGAEETEGVLIAAFDREPPDPDAAEDPIFALADLCAVAIRKARLEHALTERAEWIGRLATTDALTGLANRTTFERMLELEIARASRQNAELSLVLFDVDRMSAINEGEGSDVGDDVLRWLASALADHVRVIDTIGRTGADEFGLIAPGGGGEAVARRVRDAAARLRTPGGAQVSIHAAAVMFPDDGGSSTELMNAASAALDEAGAEGPGSIVTRS